MRGTAFKAAHASPSHNPPGYSAAVLLIVNDTPDAGLQNAANAAGCRASRGTLIGKSASVTQLGVRRRMLGLMGRRWCALSGLRASLLGCCEANSSASTACAECSASHASCRIAKHGKTGLSCWRQKACSMGSGMHRQVSWP